MIHQPKIDEFILNLVKSLDFVEVVESKDDFPMLPRNVVLSKPTTDELSELHQVDLFEELRDMVANELWIVLLTYVMSSIAKLAASNTIGDLVIQNRMEDPDWGDADWMITCSELLPISPLWVRKIMEDISPGSSTGEYKKFKASDGKGRDKFLYWFYDGDGWRLIGDFDFVLRGSGKIVDLLVNKIAWEDDNAFSIKCLLRPHSTGGVSNACQPSS